MKNYYITENDEKIEIIDNIEINLSNKDIKEIHISSLNKCEILYLSYNNLTEFNANLLNCKILYLDRNNLTSFNCNLPNIEQLYLQYNCLKSFINDLFGCNFATNCKDLYLHGNDLLSYKRLNNKSTFYI